MSFFSMARLLFKSFIKGPETILYPLEAKPVFAKTRGKILIDMESCIFCGSCERRCPVGAIKVNRATKEWSIDRFSCIQCGYCCEVCPKKCLHIDNYYTEPSAEMKREEYQNA
ncbi:MAG TPA: 4Fe-4S dicluster domain-containing protein [Candidatus Avacidaminococcus intestinavium]|uniref:4Fe-4S dicluster domain-containing protein n=1 Tax=Candidatus Avacidaminococcus intestinavium TaxID=2840684 RepID=A0A9D1SME0_9FIRM|nr:4Fe-4S dicluster domain-containing protein [Candidatus Avacidaminococcus intestinavium]